MSETPSTEPAKRVCFYICPIGSPDSIIRKRSNQIFDYIITPMAKQCGYTDVLRADTEEHSGLITSRIIDRLIESELVVADLTGQNPNVFYELAIRHAAQKPVIQIIKKDEHIPFDVSQMNTIHLDHNDLDSVEECKSALVKKMLAFQENPNTVENPLTQAASLKSMKDSPDPETKGIALVMEMIQSLENRLFSEMRNLVTQQITIDPTDYRQYAALNQARVGKLGSSLPDDEIRSILDFMTKEFAIKSRTKLDAHELFDSYAREFGLEPVPIAQMEARLSDLSARLSQFRQETKDYPNALKKAISRKPQT